MPPKDKAIELYSKYLTLGQDFTRGVSMKEFAKQCALIAVKEFIVSLMNSDLDLAVKINFWQNVKAEIEKI